MTTTERLLTIRQVSDLTGLSVRQITYAINRGQLPATKLPGRTQPYLIDREEAVKFAELRESA